MENTIYAILVTTLLIFTEVIADYLRIIVSNDLKHKKLKIYLVSFTLSSGLILLIGGIHLIIKGMA